MPSGLPAGDDPLTPGERRRLASLREARSLEELMVLTDASGPDEAYFRAKDEWYDLVERAERARSSDAPGGIPGDCVVVDGHRVAVHGVTHANTDAEARFLRDRVADLLEAGAGVYCEQGLRSMYFDDVADVCEMDDYRWAMERCGELDAEADLPAVSNGTLEGIGDEVDSLRSRVPEMAFSLIESGGDVYGEPFKRALGDLASSLLVDRERRATGHDFEAFSISRAAATDPDRLADLQQYYRKAFLPQPVEREWLRRHDPRLEVLTHARNERMADYAVYHAGGTATHLLVGAAHQPGVTYYLRRHAGGDRSLGEFELLG